MEMDLVTRHRRESGKVPIIFAAIDASCQASSGESAESAVHPASPGCQKLTRHGCDIEECAAAEIFRPLPFCPPPCGTALFIVLFLKQRKIGHFQTSDIADIYFKF